MVSGFGGELYLDPAEVGWPWLSRKCVASVLACIWNLLMMAVLGSPGSEWLW